MLPTISRPGTIAKTLGFSILKIMINRNYILWFLAGLAVILLALNLYGKSKPQTGMRAVPCLVPNVALMQHIHPTLQIIVNGVPEKIPANIGLSDTCERAVHTHDANGTLHVEAQDLHPYTLGEFFAVWKRPLVTPEFTSMVVDGALSKENPATLILKDKQQIILSYTHTPNK